MQINVLNLILAGISLLMAISLLLCGVETQKDSDGQIQSWFIVQFPFSKKIVRLWRIKV